MEVGCGQAVKGIGPGYRLKTIFLSQAYHSDPEPAGNPDSNEMQNPAPERGV